MRLAAKLREWQAAGLIDDASAAAVLAYEEARERPVALFAVAGVGLLALALGLFSLVAANWDVLPATAKLGGHVLLIAAAAVATAVLCRGERTWAAEGALFLLAALTLAGIALHAQVYQLAGELWRALAWWAVLTGPVVLLLGRTRLTAYGFALMLIALAIAYAGDAAGRAGENLAVALAPALILAALALPRDERRAAFRDGLFEAGLLATLAAATSAHLGWSLTLDGADAAKNLMRLPLAAAASAGAGVLAFRRLARADAELVAFVAAGSLLAVALALAVPHGGGAGARFAGVLSFLALWGGIAALSARAGWRRLFRIAIAAIALRVFLVYFELFYSLAFTGVGLMIGGLLLIALAWGWTRVVRSAAR